MPGHEPIPPSLERSARAWARYKALANRMVLALGVALLIALLYVKLTGAMISAQMVIAAVAGLFFTLLIGTALMGLAYFNSQSGHEDSAQPQEDKHDFR